MKKHCFSSYSKYLGITIVYKHFYINSTRREYTLEYSFRVQGVFFESKVIFILHIRTDYGHKNTEGKNKYTNTELFDVFNNKLNSTYHKSR